MRICTIHVSFFQIELLLTCFDLGYCSTAKAQLALHLSKEKPFSTSYFIFHFFARSEADLALGDSFLLPTSIAVYLWFVSLFLQLFRALLLRLSRMKT